MRVSRTCRSVYRFGKDKIARKRSFGSYRIKSDDKHKRIVNEHQAEFVKGNKNEILLLDNVDMLTSKELVKNGISKPQITVIECVKKVYKEMSLDVNIVHDRIEKYVETTSRKKIDSVYLDLNGNNLSLKVFERTVRALPRHDVSPVLRISTTFSVGRSGRMTEPELYNRCLDVMEEAFPDHTIKRGVYYTYPRNNGSMWMHYTQFILEKL